MRQLKLSNCIHTISCLMVWMHTSTLFAQWIPANLSKARSSLSAASVGKVQKEMRVKYGRLKISYLISAFLETLLGFFFFKFNLKLGAVRANEYLSQLIANADTLTIDGRINTILSGKTENRMQFLNYLKKREKEGKLLFGHHHSKESIMTCYIENMNAKHIHFIDGSDGGYTEAAKELKAKLAIPYPTPVT